MICHILLFLISTFNLYSMQEVSKEATLACSHPENMKKSALEFATLLKNKGYTVADSIIADIEQKKEECLSDAYASIGKEFDSVEWQQYQKENRNSYVFDNNKKIIFDGIQDGKLKHIINTEYSIFNIPHEVTVQYDTHKPQGDQLAETFVVLYPNKSAQKVEFLVALNPLFFNKDSGVSDCHKQAIIAYAFCHIHKKHAVDQDMFRKFVVKKFSDKKIFNTELALEYLREYQDYEASLFPCIRPHVALAMLSLVKNNNGLISRIFDLHRAQINLSGIETSYKAWKKAIKPSHKKVSKL